VGNPPSPDAFFSGAKDKSEHYALGDASPDDFDAALKEAKAEGDHNRAIVGGTVNCRVS
jgi:hypothetical protein